MRNKSEKPEEVPNNPPEDLTNGPFAATAPKLVSLGILPIPCGGDDGKRPLLSGWPKLTLSELERQLPNLVRRFGKANVGIACEASGLTIVDIDDERLLEAALKRFGQTPLEVGSPSGGSHLYYRAGDEPVRNRNLRTSEGLDIDIKSAGGLIMAPPSVNPKKGKAYHFDRGSWDEILKLPEFPTSALPDSRARPASRPRTQPGRAQSSIPVGERNATLFSELLKHAAHCDDFDALLDVARTRNEFRFQDPLPDSEVEGIARSAWRYQEEGRNWRGRSPRTILTREQLLVFARHKSGGDALLLWAYLEGSHAKRNEAFVVDREAMARDDMLPGWTAHRYRRAIATLRELELLVRVGGGGRRPDKTIKPYTYRLERPKV